MGQEKDGWAEVPLPKDDATYEQSLDWIAKRMNGKKMKGVELVAFYLVVDAVEEYETENRI